MVQQAFNERPPLPSDGIDFLIRIIATRFYLVIDPFRHVLALPTGPYLGRALITCSSQDRLL